jgi:hypothetical protein
MKRSLTRELVFLALVFCALLWLRNERGRGESYSSIERWLESDIKSLETSVALYESEFGVFPRSLSALIEVDPPSVEVLPLDPWGAEYILELDPSGARFRIGSYGSDGKPGGTDSAVDTFSAYRDILES